MRFFKTPFFLTKSILIVLTLCITSCGSENEEQKKYHDKHVREGFLVDSRKYELPVMEDKSSILHPKRLEKLGFKVSWSVRLQNQRELHDFWLLDNCVIIETEDHQIHSLNRHPSPLFDVVDSPAHQLNRKPSRMFPDGTEDDKNSE